MAKKHIEVIRVVPMTGRDTYRAIGRVFPRRATDIPVSELSPSEIEKLKNDPHLSATDATIEVDEGDGEPKGEDGAPAGDGRPTSRRGAK